MVKEQIEGDKSDLAAIGVQEMGIAAPVVHLALKGKITARAPNREEELSRLRGTGGHGIDVSVHQVSVDLSAAARELTEGAGHLDSPTAKAPRSPRGS